MRNAKVIKTMISCGFRGAEDYEDRDTWGERVCSDRRNSYAGVRRGYFLPHGTNGQTGHLFGCGKRYAECAFRGR